MVVVYRCCVRTQGSLAKDITFQKLREKESCRHSKHVSRVCVEIIVEMGESVAKLLSGIAKTEQIVFLKCTCPLLKFMGVTLLTVLHKSLLLVQQYRVTWPTFYRIALRWCDKFSAFSAM